MVKLGTMARRSSSSRHTLPGRYASTSGKGSNNSIYKIIIIYFSLLVPIAFLILIFTGIYEVTIGGVPSSILIKAFKNQEVRAAYFKKDSEALHDRLDDIGIEEDMKDYYRPQIPNEVALDQHIHQILYDRTGYVGEAYRVNSNGILVLKGK